MKQFTKLAQAALNSRDFALAVAIYEQAIREHPELVEVYKIGLNHARTMVNIPQTCDMRKIDGKNGIFLNDLYDEVAQAILNTPFPAIAETPLVSVLMTAHNVEEYIESAATSVLHQTWPQIELIVVDDASTDNTWTILQRLSKADGRLRCRRLNTNLGTYFAKNYALTIAQGDFLFFQDGDDMCHPERIRLGMRQLMEPGVVCVRGAYSRVQFPSAQVLPVNGLVKKLGLITLGVRRHVFHDIGFFNCTSKASDDEFFQRLKSWTSKNGGEIRDIDTPTYYNTWRDGSLFADMVGNTPDADGCIQQQPSPSRAQYVEAFVQQHRELDTAAYKKFFRFPVLRDLIPVAPDMTFLPNPKLPVVACLCSIPERVELLERTLSSLAPQVDELHIYLDRYEFVPNFIQNCHPNVHVVLSIQQPGLRDNGKFLPFPTLNRECHYFTADDDIIYPPDYVAAMIRRIDHYGRQAVIGVHGVVLPERPEGYFFGYRKVFSFKHALERDALVNNLGTGTVAFHSKLLTGLTLEHFSKPGMADLYFSIFCKQRKIPMVAISRHHGWLEEQAAPNTSLYHEFRTDDSMQGLLVRVHRPWGYSAIRQSVNATVQKMNNPDVSKRLQGLVPVVHPCLM